MDANPFTNKWAAIALALLVILAAVALVGDEEGQGVLGDLADRAAGRHARAGDMPPPMADIAPPSRPAAPPPAEPAADFADDDVADTFDEDVDFHPDSELVDDAEGFDSTPMIIQEREPDSGTVFEVEGETAIVLADAGEEGL